MSARPDSATRSNAPLDRRPEFATNGSPVRTKGWPAWPVWDDNDRARLEQVLESGEWGGYSPLVEQFEAAFAASVGARHAITAPNGSLTLEAALRTLGVGPGDEVVVPAYTFVATAFCVTQVGARPVFADIDADTLNLDPEALRAALTERTKAVIPVHFAGLPADLDAICAIASQAGIAVVEDAAHAHGSSWRGRPVGTLGRIGSFSFQASKNMTSGEGGVCVTDDDRLAERLWSVGNLGRKRQGHWYEHPNLGTNYRLSGWAAAVLLGQLVRLPGQVDRRMASARYLSSRLGPGLVPLAWDERADRHSFHLYCLRYEPESFGGRSRDEVVTALVAEGIPASSGYPMSLPSQPALAPYLPASCPVSDQACRELIWLPQNVLLAEESDLDDVVAAVAKVRAATA